MAMLNNQMVDIAYVYVEKPWDKPWDKPWEKRGFPIGKWSTLR